jgi:Flp pilus assembly protein TadD
VSPTQHRIGIVLLLSAVASEPAAAATDACAGSERAVVVAEKALDGGDWDEAERRLQPLAASHADCGRLVVAQARLRAGDGDAAEAARLFDRALTLLPRDALAHAQAACFWLSHGRPARADYLSAIALSLDAANAEALVVQGRILAQRGQPDAAREAFDRAVRLAPQSPEAHYQLGSWLYRRLLYAEAAPHFETAAALRPADARALGHLALSLERLGDPEQAENAYRRASKVNDGPFGDPFLDYYYGRFLLKQDRLEESALHLDRAVALHPDERGVHYERAKLKLARQDYAGAREDAERAKGLHDPGAVIDLQVYYLLATIYARLGEVDLARDYAELARTTPIPDQAADRPR